MKIILLSLILLSNQAEEKRYATVFCSFYENIDKIKLTMNENEIKYIHHMWVNNHYEVYGRIKNKRWFTGFRKIFKCPGVTKIIFDKYN